jgi:hypothetical protein
MMLSTEGGDPLLFKVIFAIAQLPGARAMWKNLSASGHPCPPRPLAFHSSPPMAGILQSAVGVTP